MVKYKLLILFPAPTLPYLPLPPSLVFPRSLLPFLGRLACFLGLFQEPEPRSPSLMISTNLAQEASLGTLQKILAKNWILVM